MEETSHVVIGMLKIYDVDAYALLDLGDNLSFVTPFLTNRFHVYPEVLNESFEVCTFIGESIAAKRVYKD